MPQGLEVYNSVGTLIMSTADFTFRFLGSIQISQPSRTDTSGGSISVGGFSTGLPTAFFQAQVPTPDGVTVGTIQRTPRITISGTTLSWDYPWPNNGSSDILVGIIPGMTGVIIYGVR